MINTSLDLDKAKKFCELLAVWLGVLSSSCPILGFITKQIYFAKFGAENVSSSFLEYAKTGALVESFILVALFIYLAGGVLARTVWLNIKEMFPIYFFSWDTGESTHEVPKFDKYIGRGAVIGALLGMSGGAFLILYWIFTAGIESDWHKVWLTGAAAGGAFLLLIYLVLVGGEYSGLRLASAALMLIVSLVFAAGHAALFGQTVCADVPGYLGGCKPREIRLSLKDDPQTRRFARDEGLMFSEGSLQVENVRLIAEAESGYLMLVDNPLEDGEVIFLDRGMVHNIQKAAVLP
jgi:hypothetical protein